MVLFLYATFVSSSDDLLCKHHYNLEFQGRGVLAWNGEQVDRVMAMLASAYQCGVLFGAVACLYLHFPPVGFWEDAIFFFFF